MVQIHPDPPIIGGVAQLGERMLCKHEVIGSIPFTSTNDFAARNHNGGMQIHRTLSCALDMNPRQHGRQASRIYRQAVWLAYEFLEQEFIGCIAL